MLKKIMLAAIALSVLGAPLAQAQSHAQPSKPGIHKNEPKRPAPHKAGPAHKPGFDKAKHWSKGQRYSDWRRNEVRDYKRHGLRAPARGQRWVKVDNQFLLVSTATGLILSALSGR